MGFNLPLLNRRRRLGGGAPAFSPAALFASAEPGVWYDPSDLTTLFTDTAGTTPVTAPGQTVALALDKSKGLVLGPELVTNGDFSAGATGWVVSSGASISGGVATIIGSSSIRQDNINFELGKTYEISFDVTRYVAGALTINLALVGTTVSRLLNPPSLGANKLYLLSTGNTRISFAGNSSADFDIDNISVKELPGFHATQSILASRPTYAVVPATGRRNLLLATDTLATQSVTVAAVAHTLSFTGTGTVTLSGASTAGPLVGTGASNRVSLTFTPTAASLTLTVSGSVTLAQLEIGSTATNYQRVGTAFDVTEAGVQSLSYLSFDGIDDFLVTPTVTPGVDKAQVFAGVRKLSDAAAAVLAELSVDRGTNAGSFTFFAPPSAAAEYQFRSRGSVDEASPVVASGFAAPITNVLAGLGDIAGDRSTIRVNGTQIAQSTSDQGTGNYLAYPLYIGRRGGTSNPFNGHIYSLIVRFGANLDAATITSTESWAAGKTGVTL
jgi:hypothetical protein